MHPVGHRHERIAEEIHHEVDSMLAGELRDPRLEASVTVTEVRLQPDMKVARIFVSIIGHAAGAVRRARRAYRRPRVTFATNSPNASRCAAARICNSSWTLPRSRRAASRNCCARRIRRTKPPQDSGPDNPSEQS